ncbi:MAG: hypothetical protein KGS61_11700 [Verrucomicrobia bacterium]|nr:hypothetical protein [Verrucomicrobiota bacterium]
MADLLQRECGVEVNRVKGSIQELSVQVGDQVVARKKWFRFPEDAALVGVVKQALAATA